MEEHKEHVDEDLKTEIESAISEVEATLENEESSADEISDSLENLSLILQEIGKRIYDENNAQSATSPDSSENQEEEPIDAEIEDV